MKTYCLSFATGQKARPERVSLNARPPSSSRSPRSIFPRPCITIVARTISFVQFPEREFRNPVSLPLILSAAFAPVYYSSAANKFEFAGGNSFFLLSWKKKRRAPCPTRDYPSADVLNLREVHRKYNIVEATCTSMCVYVCVCVCVRTYVWNLTGREREEGLSGPSGGRYNKLEKATGHLLLPLVSWPLSLPPSL